MRITFLFHFNLTFGTPHGEKILVRQLDIRYRNKLVCDGNKTGCPNYFFFSMQLYSKTSESQSLTRSCTADGLSSERFLGRARESARHVYAEGLRKTGVARHDDEERE